MKNTHGSRSRIRMCLRDKLYLVLARWIKLRKAAKWHIVHSFAQTHTHMSKHLAHQIILPLYSLSNQAVNKQWIYRRRGQMGETLTHQHTHTHLRTPKKVLGSTIPALRAKHQIAENMIAFMIIVIIFLFFFLRSDCCCLHRA